MTNNVGVDLAAAIWLAHDDYDYVDKPNYISVTTMIKPPRQIILGARVNQLAQQQPEAAIPVDIIDRFKSRLGQSLHTGVEESWKLHYRTSMEKLGIPKRVIDMVRINPEQEEPDTLPVYTEQRVEREIAGYVVGGKIDLIIEGRLRDVKSTTVYKYTSQKGVGQWRLQGSLYRWLNPGKVHHDEFLVQYLLVDWLRSFAGRDPKYPAHAAPTRAIRLMSLEETDKWVRDRLRLLTQLKDAPEATLPDCSEEDLWRSEPVFKYYSNPDKTTGRSTKNFDTQQEANAYRAEKGKGVVLPKPGVVKACNYCPCAPICGQYQRLLASGDIASDA
jgi:hypothetical protein